MPITLSRRPLLAAGAALLGTPRWAGLPAAQAQEAGAALRPPIYRFGLGAFTVAALSDGYLPFDVTAFVVNISREEIEQAMAEVFLDPGAPLMPGVTAHLVRSNDRTILIDAGTSDLFGPTLGHVPAGLAELGVAPEDVDAVLVTHMHGDHVGGLLAGGAPRYPNASIHVSEPELAFWTDPALAAQAPEEARPTFELAAAVAAAHADRLEPFAPDAEVLPGITSVSLPGHTPGQCGFRIASGGDELLIFGDAANIASVQFRHPEAGLVFDVDAARAAETRRRLFDMLATDRTRVAGTHMPFPGIGYVARSDGAYAWVPEEWRYQ